MEAMLENKKAMAIEKINLLMENKEKKFNPLLNFTLTKVLSEIAPQFYTEQELTQIKEISQNYCQAMKDNTMKGDKVNNKGRCRSSDEDSVSYGERRVKPKPTEKRELKKQNKETILSPPPKLPTLVENKIKELNGHDIRYIMCKKLYWSDLDKDKNRLSMPIKKEKLDFLLDIEKEILEDNNTDDSDELKVIVLDPCFRKFTMSLRKWYMGTSSVYNLIQDWNFVVSKNSFEIDQLLNIWSFRDVNNKLHFVLDDYKNSLITTQVKLEIEGCGKLENSGDWEPNNIEESNKKQKEEGEESS